MNWLKKLLGLCEHKWKIIHNINIFENASDEIPCGTKIVLQCEKCGDIKTRTL